MSAWRVVLMMTGAWVHEVTSGEAGKCVDSRVMLNRV